MTTITYTRRPLAIRLRNALRRAYLRVLIASAERDVIWHEAQAQLEPARALLARERAAELRCELAQL